MCFVFPREAHLPVMIWGGEQTADVDNVGDVPAPVHRVWSNLVLRGVCGARVSVDAAWEDTFRSQNRKKMGI